MRFPAFIKTSLVLFFILFSFFCSPALSFATEMNGIVDEITPAQLNSDRQDTVTINLKSKDGSGLFVSTIPYELLLCPPGIDVSNTDRCVSNGDTLKPTSITSTQLTFQFKVFGRLAKSGTFNYKVYPHKTNESINNSIKQTIFTSSFFIAPPASGNGKLPVFTLPDTVQERSSPVVTFINVLPETSYTVWWDGERTSWNSFIFPADHLTGDPPQTRTTMDPVSRSARPEPYKVCMGKFDDKVESVIGKSCDYSLYVKVVKDISGITPGTASSDPTIGGASPPPQTQTKKWPPVIDKSNLQCYVQSGTDIKINKVTNIASDTKYFTWWHGEKAGVCNGSRICPTSDSKGTDLSFTIPGSATKDKTGQQTFCISTEKAGFIEPDSINTDGCKEENSITFEFSSLPPSSKDTSCANITAKAPSPPPAPCQVESQGTKDNGTGLCLSLNTALGKIELEPSKLISSILGMLLSLAGGIALFIIIRSGYTLMTSQGNPEKVKEAREAITSAVVGILFMVFSVIILQVIGVDILHIPGLS